MSKKDQSNEEDLQNKEESLNGSDVESDTDQELESSHQDDNKEEIGTLTYEELLDKKEELEGLLLRANADLDNALKRTLTEVEKAHKYGTERLLIDLLPIIDNLENALSNLSKNSTKEDKEGIELTLKSFESTLDKFGMVPIYPEGEEFNPEKHEAVSMEEDKNKKDGFIGNIYQRGWELHSRVIRPARVTVVKN